MDHVNIYELNMEERQGNNIGELPSSLIEALEELENDNLIKNALGEEIYTAFIRAKMEEWKNYSTYVTDWEVKNYLESE